MLTNLAARLTVTWFDLRDRAQRAAQGEDGDIGLQWAIAASIGAIIALTVGAVLTVKARSAVNSVKTR